MSLGTKLLVSNAVDPQVEDVQFTLMMLIHENKHAEFAEVYMRYKA
jgi:Ankyrin repeats (3 copies)